MSGEVDECSWVGPLVGGRVVRASRQGARRHGSRPAWFVHVERGDGSETACYVRMQRPEYPDGGAALRREFGVLGALRAAGVRVPEVYALSEDPGAIVMECLRGEGDYVQLTDSAQRRVLDHQFLGQLAKLHGADIGPFVELGLRAPSSPAEFVTLDLNMWEGSYRSMARRPVPLLEFACRWLRRHIPAAPEGGPVVVQGDTGPGQFMFDGDEMTGIVDWEFALLGDPMLDLALIRGRDFYNPGADLRDWFATYAQLSGRAIDWEKVSYYTVKALAITPLSLAGLCQRMPPAADHAEWYAETATFGRATAQALVEAIGGGGGDGHGLGAVELPEERPGRLAGMFDLMEENLRGELMPADEPGRHRMGLVLRLLTMMRNADALDGRLVELELDDLAPLLGRRPVDLVEGDRLLLEEVAEESAAREAELAAYFWRRSVREEALLRGALGAGEEAVLIPLNELR